MSKNAWKKRNEIGKERQEERMQEKPFVIKEKKSGVLEGKAKEKQEKYKWKEKEKKRKKDTTRFQMLGDEKQG